MVKRPAFPVRVGCCGWSYREWVGVFYTSPRNLFLQYSKHFRTAEIDSTFYTIPRRETFSALARLSPNDFRFTAKLPKTVTHEERCALTFKSREKLSNLLTSIEPLGEKLSHLLVQLPPSFTYAERDTLVALLDTLSEKTDKRLSVEFRHLSWFSEENVAETKRMLAERRVACVVADEPLLPPVLLQSSDTVYVRMHGRGRHPWYDYRYSQEELNEWVTRIKSYVMDRNTGEVIVVFNNHPHGYAPQNALSFQELLEQSGITQPPRTPLAKKSEPTLDDFVPDDRSLG